MKNGWQIRDDDNRLGKARKLAKLRAVEREISIAQALAELVEAGAGREALARVYGGEE